MSCTAFQIDSGLFRIDYVWSQAYSASVAGRAVTLTTASQGSSLTVSYTGMQFTHSAAAGRPLRYMVFGIE